MPDSNVAIKLENISKHYRLYNDPKDRLKEALNPFRKSYHKKHEALRNVDLTIYKGDVIGIVGRNGCGKSTLLKIITKVLQPNEGSVTVNGQVTALLELGAGFNPEFTGLDNIRFYANVLGLSHDEIEQKLDTIIGFAELGDYLHQPVKTYSSGMQARLGFAVAAHVDPDILILDEVLAVGDALFRRKCYAKMEEFFKGGKTVVYVSHDANSVNQLCNRAVLIHEGSIALDGLPSDVTKHYEKLLFSKDVNRPNIKPQTGLIQSESSDETHSRVNSIRVSQADDVVSTLKPYLIPGYVPKSTVSYPSNGAHILNSKITTLDGERVNVLVSAHKYYYSYDVKFDRPYDQISFGIKIKTANGFELSGSSTYLSGELLSITECDKTVHVKWGFECNLLQGEYYTNAGVSYHGGGSIDFLAREVDNLVFKVVTKRQYLPNGIVDLRQNISITQDNVDLL